MRVTTEIWVSALLRRARSGGAFAYLVRRGAEEAGTVFVVVDDMSSQISLWGPAPQTSYDGDGQNGDRDFEMLMEAASREEVQKRLDSEIKFDSDVWIVEVEDSSNRNFI